MLAGMSTPLYVQLGAVKASLDIKSPDLGSEVYVVLEAAGHSMTIHARELMVAVPALIQMAGLDPETVP